MNELTVKTYEDGVPVNDGFGNAVLVTLPEIKSHLIIIPGQFELHLTSPRPDWFRRGMVRWLLGWEWEKHGSEKRQKA